MVLVCSFWVVSLGTNLKLKDNLWKDSKTLDRHLSAALVPTLILTETLSFRTNLVVSLSLPEASTMHVVAKQSLALSLADAGYRKTN